jgi:uncharacterized membrane protein YheB (UPF0754 family)
MVLNDVLTKQNVFTKLLITSDGKELPKELKVKVMRIRMAYSKIKNNFDSEVNEFVQELITDEFKELSSKEVRTSEEEVRYKELASSIDSEYLEFVKQKGNEEVKNIDDTFTMDEYADIVEVNASNDVEINNTLIPAIDFLEIVFNLFVKE